jgi:glycosyltransferase involved in cell wall biosynthesis
MKAPLVTLIMPAWQPRPEWLRQAVRSALEQRGCAFELLVVDDGCPEPLADLLSHVEDSRLRVLRIPHGGPSAARNAGIAAASGDLIRFVDADDVFDPDSTARLARRIGANETIAYGDTCVCDAQLRPVWRMAARIEGPAAREALLGLFQVRVTSMLFPRSVIDATGEWDAAFPASGDWDFVLRALEHAPVRRDPGIATYYRRHAASITGDLDAGQVGARRVVARYFDRHPQERGTPLEQRAEARLAAMAARIYLMHGRRRDAAAQLRSALAKHPGAVLDEVRLVPPALAGKARYKLRRAVRRGA